MSAARERERDIAEALLELVAEARQDASMAAPGSVTSDRPAEPPDASTGAMLAAKLKERLSSAEQGELQRLVEMLLD
jgi:hypothetical protein